MPKAIQIDEYGPPAVLHVADVTLLPLRPEEVRFRVIAAPVNHADIEIRSGNWPIMAEHPFPYTPGLEALGDFVAWDLLQDLHLTGYSSENLTGADLRADMAQLCQWLAAGQLAVPAHQMFSLGDAAMVHELMEWRELTGRALLIP